MKDIASMRKMRRPSATVSFVGEVTGFISEGLSGAGVESFLRGGNS
jgi:hypothetical protein